ncbi:voltage-gated hydrogen channel 1-like [Amphibalanus amphitrite]|uniref:voltage-gated hydrogen channel 1-like n=1 Tax=Amphibalanus amphitrite TaxID=1232801 RepID=UPI001C914C88|nr:voltage-gated hydrogen channel 1-like [Amphibalanus amphitrite]XP_043216745.1 voltage-gated hydrogen channel 1-like [Amphibalanus amphitrite]XP_043216746.1 voltage-gated hydrogen channel 1-like [Amphibalanus amphitrite]XP_043216747.1 voltage-gated hydrogen channel 1-like [Amphibalanus amphitrite]XP_043216748.1 voltage-gated hydrogen channel 1-like [Amphibalanus amphitrite]XP_043216749.1 voltage-gated hydrogen channel 1-like [Amphibalanus amphitrite]XP_043216750.1 voltage-gated hydrogen cha
MAATPPAVSSVLDGHQQLANELRVKIADGPGATDSGPGGGGSGELRPYATARERLAHLVHSYRYQTVVIALVILDCICVIAELLIDLEIASAEGSHVVKTVLHNISIAILSLFLLEIPVKLYVYRLEYFRMPWELFDALVVIVSFSLDVAFRHSVGPINGAGLIIVLRLWRVTRILSGMVMSVRRHSEHKLEQEREARYKVQHELDQWREYCTRLEELIRDKGLPLPDGRPLPSGGDSTER